MPVPDVYLMLMTILVLNIIIAILMDAYSSVKTEATSSYTEQLKYNVGPIWNALYDNMRRPFLSSKKSIHLKWSDDRWIRDLNIIMQLRGYAGLPKHVLRMGELMVDLKSLPTSAGEDLQWQLLQTFQLRDFQPPSNIFRPHEEPDIDANVIEVRDSVRAQDKRIAQITKLVSDLHQRLDAAGIAPVIPEADVSSKNKVETVAQQVAKRAELAKTLNRQSPELVPPEAEGTPSEGASSSSNSSAKNDGELGILGLDSGSSSTSKSKSPGSKTPIKVQSSMIEVQPAPSLSVRDSISDKNLKI